ncbi:MAG: hypothetical protein M1438_09605 [Deltaproteobacteria bacterium]|nr:hypothetical protein [Deltaproteobacteria bacterium]
MNTVFYRAILDIPVPPGLEGPEAAERLKRRIEFYLFGQVEIARSKVIRLGELREGRYPGMEKMEGL